MFKLVIGSVMQN